MVMHPQQLPSTVPSIEKGFEWRSNTGHWRWLILSALGAIPSACGGRTDALGGSNGISIEGEGGSRGTLTSTPRGTHPVAATAGGSAGAAGRSMASGGSAGRSSASGGNAGSGTVSPPEPETFASECQNATAIGGGWLRCDNRMLHRPSQGTCTSSVPRAERVMIPPQYDKDGWREYLSCREDSDCTDDDYGHCAWEDLSRLGTFCNYGCVVDADCNADQVCLCGEPVGQCVPASCATDTDCGAGNLCANYIDHEGCGGTAFACQTTSDVCAAQSDCINAAACTVQSIGGTATRVCGRESCPAIGRPFLVDGVERLAPSLARADWYPGQTNGPTPSLGLDETMGADLARRWTEQALMEHASVAAFARFSLQLLSLGAPAVLVQRSGEAMQDEIRHARSCFELARHYSGADVGPGPLPIHGALEEADLCSIVLGTIAEGCIGETVAALEAAEALAHCEEPHVRAVLERISVEESRHAELAWQFVAWALASGPAALRQRVRETFEAAFASADTAAVQPSSFEAQLLRHGQLSSELRRALRARVLRDVIAPCAEALLEPAERKQAAPREPSDGTSCGRAIAWPDAG
jgi:hypothetical protein